MAPRRAPKPQPPRADGEPHAGPRASIDKLRHREDAKHHPMAHPDPHPPHHPHEKPPLPPRHHPHSHPHTEDLGPHTNKPGPIKPQKKVTRTGEKQ